MRHDEYYLSSRKLVLRYPQTNDRNKFSFRIKFTDEDECYMQFGLMNLDRADRYHFYEYLLVEIKKTIQFKEKIYNIVVLDILLFVLYGFPAIFPLTFFSFLQH